MKFAFNLFRIAAGQSYAQEVDYMDEILNTGWHPDLALMHPNVLPAKHVITDTCAPNTDPFLHQIYASQR